MNIFYSLCLWGWIEHKPHTSIQCWAFPLFKKQSKTKNSKISSVPQEEHLLIHTTYILDSLLQVRSLCTMHAKNNNLTRWTSCCPLLLWVSFPVQMIEEEERHFQSACACVECYQQIDSYPENPAFIDNNKMKKTNKNNFPVRRFQEISGKEWTQICIRYFSLICRYFVLSGVHSNTLGCILNLLIYYLFDC